MQKTGGIGNFPQCPSAVFNLGAFIIQKRRARTKDCTPLISHVNSRQLKGIVGTATHCVLYSSPFRAALASQAWGPDGGCCSNFCLHEISKRPKAQGQSHTVLLNAGRQGAPLVLCTS